MSILDARYFAGAATKAQTAKREVAAVKAAAAPKAALHHTYRKDSGQSARQIRG